jgi:hypothetical protein
MVGRAGQIGWRSNRGNLSREALLAHMALASNIFCCVAPVAPGFWTAMAAQPHKLNVSQLQPSSNPVMAGANPAP